MMTWKLWRTLTHTPATHPLYRRTMIRRPKEGLRFDEAVTLNLLWRLVMPLVFVSLFALTPIILPLVVITPVLLPVIINWFSLQWTLKTSSAIAREREQNSYDLMALIPPGAFVAVWMIASASVHRGASFADLNTLVQLLVRLLLIVLGLALVIAIIIAASGRPETFPPTLVTLTAGAALVAAIYLDFVQSAVIAGLVGMLTPTLTRNALDVRAWSFLGFLLLQVTAYLVMWVVGFLLVPAFYQMLNLTGFYAEFSLPILRVTVLYIVREGIIAGLWHALLRQLNALPTDLGLILP